MDGRCIARVLMRMEEVLNGELLDEVRELAWLETRSSLPPDCSPKEGEGRRG
jgi:hypothetical protein